MRSEKIFRLGRITIDGDLIEFEREEPLTFEAERADRLSVGIAYDYREASEDKEHTRIRLTAHVDGQKPETFEAVIGDSPALNDSRRGFVSVPIRVAKSGEVRGRFVVETTYAAGPWKAGAEPDATAAERAEGEFVVRVK